MVGGLNKEESNDNNRLGIIDVLFLACFEAIMDVALPPPVVGGLAMDRNLVSNEVFSSHGIHLKIYLSKRIFCMLYYLIL